MHIDNSERAVEDGASYINAPLLPPPRRSQRNAAFELLRIVCMFFIIGHHFICHGGWGSGVSDEVNAVFVRIFESLFVPSVDLFVMIGAYFLCTSLSERVNVRKVARLWRQVFFYGILLFAVFVATDTVPYSADYLLSVLFPTLKERYWFFSAYIVMLVLSPFINAMLRNLSRRSHLTLCLIIIVAAEITGDANIFGTIGISNGYNAVWFCCLYVIAAYLRLYDVRLTRRTAVAGAIFYVASVVAGYFFSFDYTSAAISLSAVFLFLVFKHMNIKNRLAAKTICFVSPLTFGVYLIHDSPEMRSFMYENIFHCSEMFDLPSAFLVMLGYIAATFVACAAFEYVRRELERCLSLFAGYLKDRLVSRAATEKKI